MDKRNINSAGAPKALGGYSQAVEVCNVDRILFVSGQVPISTAGELPEAFIDQARLVWKNIEAQLKAGDMSLDSLAKVTIFLSDRSFAEENRAVRNEILGNRAPALTVIITGIFDSAWLLEIEAIAVASRG